ncbi:pentatricopeptide repeat-containing protein At1g53600, mitochondrial [Coffea eugenioides]|uniref:pentatricopeptide repeat-containing protein At1g53600, mitochondrial n=1 Tax=Coffea eugenioides TaxID=49369 RepID=UPI000F60D8AC|nr:pentatricopeptide repeat-containing protein At1g53600, mitochondrial [Coffea eugenioides]
MLANRTSPQLYKALKKPSLQIFSTLVFATQTNLSKTKTETNKFLVYCNSQITKHGRDGNIKEAESVFNRMPTRNVVSYTAMLTAYAQNGQLKRARELFDEMPERTIASWNAMITAYTRSKGGIFEGFRLFVKMPERNEVSCAAMITGFVNSGRFDEAEKLYNETPLELRDPSCSNVLINGYLKMGRLDEATQIFDRMMKKDVVSWSSMVDGYCKNDRVDEAREFFDAIWERNEVTWSSMINGYMKLGRFRDGLGLFSEMRREDAVRIEPILVTTIFEACGRFDRYTEGCQVHGLVSQLGFEFDVFLGNSLITMYSRFRCMDVARSVFDMMLEKDIVSWNSLISGYIQNKDLEEAYGLFEKAPEKDVVSWTTMITGYSEEGLTEKCIGLFTMMPEKDAIAWTALISGFVINGQYEEAICSFFQMLQTAVRPNPLTLSSALSASAGLATLNQGTQIHAQVIKRNMESDLSIQNTLVSFYSKCGNVDDAYRIFNSIMAPNIVSFNSMISGFAQNGFGKEALKLFEKSQSRGYEPTEITFLGVLSACTHVGLVEEGRNYFRLMKSLYKIEPGPDHYACMVDLLGRSGLLDDAVTFINSMPFVPDSGVWGALLAASRTRFRVDLAMLAAENISKLEPNNAAPYVVLSDMYSFAGKKKDEERVRTAKKLQGIKKSPGCSWITVKNKVNTFLSGDQSHASFKGIKCILCLILDEMKELHWLDHDWLPP